MPNSGSSATSSLCSSTAGSGNSATDSDSNFTGRPIACVALPAIIAWTRGVSTSRGSAIAATTSSRTTTAPIPTTHFKARFNAHLQSDYAVWIADSRQGFGPTGRVKVQYSSMSTGVVDPSTTAPVASSTV